MKDARQREREYFDALKTITKYRPAEWFDDEHARKEYGLEGREALEMAYDNIQQTARDAIRGRVRPKVGRTP